MSIQHSQPEARRPRADARRNRDRILEAAKEAFTCHGADASLDDIAKQAGVGAGTLYRHFPNRDALIEAVYQGEVEKLAASARQYAKTMPPVEALRRWMLLFVDYIAAKHIIAPALNSLTGGPSRLYQGSHGLMKEAVEMLVQRGIQSKELRPDIEPFDLLRALIGVAHIATGANWQQSAKKLVDILIAGSRRSSALRSRRP